MIGRAGVLRHLPISASGVAGGDGVRSAGLRTGEDMLICRLVEVFLDMYWSDIIRVDKLLRCSLDRN